MSKKIKVRVVALYDDGSGETVLLDEGQDFDALYKAFNEQDDAMCKEDDTNGPAHQTWLGFTDFMESKGVKVLDDTHDNLGAYR